MNYFSFNNAAQVTNAAARHILMRTPDYTFFETDADGVETATVFISFCAVNGEAEAVFNGHQNATSVRVRVSDVEKFAAFKTRLRDAITAALLEGFGDDEKSVIRYGSTLYPMTRDDLKRAEKNGFDLYPDTDGGRRWYVARCIMHDDFGGDDGAALDAIDAAEDAWNGLDLYTFCGRGYRVEFWQCGR